MSHNIHNPIGVFDSGLGGLTVIRSLKTLLPHENFIYVGDTARVPYGTKSADTIRKYALQIAFFLVRKKVKLLVVACNSVSAVALNSLRDLPIPVIGVIKPGARAAVKVTKNNRVAVVGTKATISAQAYRRMIKTLSSRVSVWEAACPLFVPLVEEGWLNHVVTSQVAKTYLAPLKKHKFDTLVLGCTHYPLLKKVLKSVVGRQVTLIDSADETAKEVVSMLHQKKLMNPSGKKGHCEFFVTDRPRDFHRLGQQFLGYSIPLARQIRFDSF